eukprot:Gb_11548 [translate_table: standard]
MRKNERGKVSVHDVLRLMGRNKAEGTLQRIEELSEVLEKGRKAITKVNGISLLHDKSPFNFKCKDLEKMHDSYGYWLSESPQRWTVHAGKHFATSDFFSYPQVNRRDTIA